MRRREFTIGLLLAAATQSVWAQERAKQYRIAIVITAGPVAGIDDPASRPWRAFWEELRRLGDVEGQNLVVERYSGEGRPEGYADLARAVVSRNPDVMVPIGPTMTQAVRAATDIIPIVASGAYTGLGVVPSLAHPGGNLTGITVDVGWDSEINGKRLQILKEAIPLASTVAVLAMRTLASAFATMNTSAAEGDDRTIRDTLLAELKAQKFAEVSRPVSPSRTASSCGVLMFICPNRRTERSRYARPRGARLE
jgi:putative ABC transport system substrate-binding protein